jgi:hypothetical protein
MTDRPILFSAPMVCALLAGRKTQTRRLCKDQPPAGVTIVRKTIRPFDKEPFHAFERRTKFGNFGGEVPVKISRGDRLWVKETWRAHGWHADCVEIAYAAQRGIVGWSEQHAQIGYPDGNRNAFKYYAPKGPDYWRPSIFMPRWASRITLTVTDVRVERLQDISEADAIAEGADQYSSSTKLSRAFNPDWKGIYRQGYAELWNAINGPGSWEANPWVVAYTFTVLKQNIDQIETVAA